MPNHQCRSVQAKWLPNRCTGVRLPGSAWCTREPMTKSACPFAMAGHDSAKTSHETRKNSLLRQDQGLSEAYMQDTEELGQLCQAVKAAVREALAESSSAHTGESIFPLYVVREAAQAFKVKDCTVRDWHKKGLLHGHYQVLSGRSCRLVFTNRDLLMFFSENFPTTQDLFDHPNSPRSSKARLIEKMFRMNRLYSRKRQRQVQDDGNQT